MGSFEAEAFSRPLIEPVLRQLYLVLGHVGEIAVLGKELPEETVEVLVGAALPGRVRMAEVVVEAAIRWCMAKLLAVVGGQGVGHAPEPVLAGDAADQRVAALALVDGHQRVRASRAMHQVRLPVAVALSAIGRLGALVDRHLVGNRAAALARAAPFATLLLQPQGEMQVPARALVLVDAPIDGLVRDAADGSRADSRRCAPGSKSRPASAARNARPRRRALAELRLPQAEASAVATCGR